MSWCWCSVDLVNAEIDLLFSVMLLKIPHRSFLASFSYYSLKQASPPWSSICSLGSPFDQDLSYNNRSQACSSTLENSFICCIIIKNVYRAHFILVQYAITCPVSPEFQQSNKVLRVFCFSSLSVSLSLD